MNGYQTGWVITGMAGRSADLHLVYVPALTARTALKISAVALPTAALWMLLVRPRLRRRLRRRRARRLQRRQVCLDGVTS